VKTITRKKLNICKHKTTNEQIDIILYEIRDLRKDVSELKSYVNKSKGTIAVIIFLSGIFATILTAWQFLKNN